MTREEILAKSREENKGFDEYERTTSLKASAAARFFGIILCSLVWIINAECGGPTIVQSAIFIVYFGMYSVESLYRAVHVKKKTDWIYGISSLFLCLGHTYLYFKRLF